MSQLSAKKIPARERLIFPLDVDSREQVNALVRQLGDAVWFYKLGLQLFMSGNYWDLVAQLVDAGKKVFVDLKFFDVPETVASAVRRMKDCGAEFATIHGNDAMLAAAARGAARPPQAARGDRAHELRRGRPARSRRAGRGLGGGARALARAARARARLRRRDLVGARGAARCATRSASGC